MLCAGLSGPLVIIGISALGPDVVTSRYLVPAAPLMLVGVATAIASRPNWLRAPVLIAAVTVAALGTARSLAPSTGDYADEERVIGYAVPELEPGTVIASESFTLGTWLASYAGRRSGV